MAIIGTLGTLHERFIQMGIRYRVILRIKSKKKVLGHITITESYKFL